MSNEKGRKDKNQNIQVFVRLRPLNQREREIKSLGVVEVSGPREVIVRTSPLQSNFSKKFTFDKAFGPNSTQVEVYREVVSPLIDEVLAGYNCTVFAYGQTGTGKTHTMVGESSTRDCTWQNDPMAGIIPRALSQLFDGLRLTNTEYTVRVSYLELYNEELFDLLSTSEDNSKLRIYEDVTRKGSNIVNGLEEMTVYNKNEVYNIMAQGQERRKVACTLMNAQSSRSHTVFTIVVHMKENSSEGEELVKIGKLNLVDLAGSENISKAGSDNPQKRERARECVNINQSLLTLGRVITSLVERHPHIPYRESKLTRILQESLGGRTKTSIIATVSPGHKDLEETLSTLEYAHRAKNIQNKPEVNQRLTRKTVLREFAEEIDRLKRDLHAAREKNGVYLANETYTEMLLRQEDLQKDLQEKILQIKAMESERERLDNIFNQLDSKFRATEATLQQTTEHLTQTIGELVNTKTKLSSTEENLEEQKYLLEQQVATEEQLSNAAQALLQAAEKASTDAHCLQDTVDKRKNLENTNLSVTREYAARSGQQRAQLGQQAEQAARAWAGDLNALKAHAEKHFLECLKRAEHNHDTTQSLLLKQRDMVELLQAKAMESHQLTEQNLQAESQQLRRVLADVVGQLQANLDSCFHIMDRQLHQARTQTNVASQNILTYITEYCDSSQRKMDELRRDQEHILEETRRSHSEMRAGHRLGLQRMRQSDSRAQYCHQALGKLLQDLMEAQKEKENSLEMYNEESNRRLDVMEECDTRNYQAAKNAMDDIFEHNAEFKNNSQQHVQSNMESVNHILQLTNDEIKNKVNDVTEKTKQATTQCTENGCLMLTRSAEACKDVVNTAVQDSLKCMDDVSSALNHMSVTLSTGVTQTTTDQDAMAYTIQTASVAPKQFQQAVETQLSAYDTMESQFIAKEYNNYSPTGKTPVRCTYKFPRSLPCTQSHSRLLKRFRISRRMKQANQEEAIEILDTTLEEPDEAGAESAPASTVSEDSSSSSDSMSDDSAVVFAEPKGGAPARSRFAAPARASNPHSTPNRNAIAKSTSEGDIYKLANKQYQNSKENSQASGKKEYVSKLKQPTSSKKVLVDKN